MVPVSSAATRRQAVAQRFLTVFISLTILAIIFNLARNSTWLNAIPVQTRGIVKWGFFAVWLVLGVSLMTHLQSMVSSTLANNTKVDMRTLMLVNRSLNAAGYSFIIVEALHLLQVNVMGILIGGAVTGVIVGIAAQSTLSNLFGGIILFALRPFSIGQTISIHSSMFGGIEYTGTVVDVNWFHTVIVNSDEQRQVFPNSAVTVSVVTIISNERQRTHVVPMPYSVALSQFESALSKATGQTVSAKIKSFSEDNYLVQVGLPISSNGDVLRRVIADLKADAHV